MDVVWGIQGYRIGHGAREDKNSRHPFGKSENPMFSACLGQEEPGNPQVMLLFNLRG